MSTKRDDASPPGIDASAKRRWMIGIMITVLFGGFGAVMAWLSYADRAQPATSPAARPTAEPGAVPDPADRKGKGHRGN